MSATSLLAAFALVACTTTGGQSGSPQASAGASASAAASAAVPDLEGTLWGLAEYLGPDGNTVTVPKEISASATFAAGTVSGNAGCNDYTGTYTVDGDKLTIGPLATTKKGCGPAQTALETAYLAALAKVATYKVSGKRLELNTAENKLGLHFTAIEATSLTTTRWVATGVNNGKGAVTSIIAGTTLTAIFSGGGTVAGSGGCNDYNGPYTSDATSIKIGPLAATRKLCNTPAGVDDQEAQFLAALSAATTYKITGSKLELRDTGGALQAAFQPTVAGG